MKKKHSLNNIIDSLIDDDGIKTEVTLTVTDTTLFKIIAALLASGVCVMLVNHLLKNQFPNSQLHRISNEVSLIQKQLEK
ncbi:hypothetical protein [Aquimarina agarivorans]|uniref:hypothetical protein n=1 Tax=Aquimarina agarivorans TaxID=980584 RepID=UPI000248FC5B|nr:hypothetical protein [Aquimarina agarivorans]